MPSDQRGFSLLEILIAVVVLSFGLLGLLSLQLATLRVAQDDHRATVALHLAVDIAEQMRNVIDADAALALWQQVELDDRTVDAVAAAATCYGSAADCSPAQLAAFEIREWVLRARSAIPGAHVQICRDRTPARWGCNGGPADPVWIKLGWRKQRSSGAANAAPATTPDIFLPAGALH